MLQLEPWVNASSACKAEGHQSAKSPITFRLIPISNWKVSIHSCQCCPLWLTYWAALQHSSAPTLRVWCMEACTHTCVCVCEVCWHAARLMSRVLESSSITCQDMETDDCPEDSCWTAQSQITVMAAEEQEVFLQLLMMKPGSLKGKGLMSILVLFELPQKQNFNPPPHTHTHTFFFFFFALALAHPVKKTTWWWFNSNSPAASWALRAGLGPTTEASWHQELIIYRNDDVCQQKFVVSWCQTGDLGSDQLRLVADGSKSGLIKRVWTFHSSNLLPSIAGVAHLCVLALQAAPTCSNNHDVIHLLFGPGEGWWLMRRLGIRILSDLGSCADRNLIKLHMPKQTGSFVHLGAKTALQLCFDIYHVWISVCFW